MLEGKKLLDTQPSYWSYLGWYSVSFIVVVLSVVAGLKDPMGWLVLCLLVVPLVAVLWSRAGMRLSVYEDQVVSSRGVLSKTENHISCADVRAIETAQSLFQRIVNIGAIRIGTAGTDGWEEEVYGIPNPSGVKDLILHRKRIEIEKRSKNAHDGE